MNSYPMLGNILGQPASLLALLAAHRAHSGPLTVAANLLRRARGTIYFTGMGASLFAALPAVDRLRLQGLRVQAVESSELLHYGSTALHRDDVGVLISRSGESVEVLHLTERMRAAGMPTIGVSNVSATTLESLSDTVLPVHSRPDQLIAVQTYTGTLTTLLLLAESTLGDPAPWSELCAASLPALTAWTEQCLQSSASWQAFLDTRQPLYLLGRGPALASVHEGALLLHETAKAPVVALSCGQFRHGPVEVVANGFRAVVLGTPRLTREVDGSLAEDLLRMGAEVRWLGPVSGDPGSSGVMPLVPWPEIDAALAPIFEIIPFQLASYRLALWRGIVPGDFRYASEITASESGFPLWEARLARV